ncbi:hypothetical protein T12_12297 [Trichinella patagoniensis]|uniref:Uncharacterized protein n=1 Tax=Trichinella patagoniensis TaxID=990121 RepID=A0A0V0YS27_9BILA|nr:hypothetical protein T12_12297 [Trichinella patagoniensis]
MSYYNGQANTMYNVQIEYAFPFVSSRMGKSKIDKLSTAAVFS